MYFFLYKKNNNNIYIIMKKTINIFLIHNAELKNRVDYINSTISFIKTLLEKNGFNTNIKMCKNKDKSQIQNDADKYKERKNYNPSDNKLYDDLITNLNDCQISNIENHRDALRHVVSNEYNLIIEDDLVINKSFIENIEKIFTDILKNNFDLLILSDFINNNDETLKLCDINTNYILVSKNSYFINKKAADKLYNYLEVIKFDMRTSLSKFINDYNNEFSCKILNKCTFLEGSKIGLFTSSTKNKNILTQNNDYITLLHISNNSIITDEMLKEVDEIYEKLSGLNNAEIIHLVGLIYYKNNNVEKALEYMQRAAYSLKDNYSYYDKNNHILNNAINIYKFNQNLNKYNKKKSKYSN